MNIDRLTLSLDGNTDNQVVEVKQGDYHSRCFEVEFLNNDEILEIDDSYEVRVNFKNLEGIVSAYDSTQADSIITIGNPLVIEVPFAIVEGWNRVKCDISLFKGNSKITSEIFTIKVNRTVASNEDWERDEHFDILKEKIKQADDAINKIDPAIEKIEGAVEKADNAIEKAEEAVKKTEGVEQAIEDAQSATTSAQNAAQNAQNVTEELQRKADAGDFDGQDGEDGFSPSAKVERINNGAKITITDKSGTTEAIVNDGQGGGEGGTSDYTKLTNKPSINGIELNGNKSLDDLNIQHKGNYALKSEIPTVDVDKAYVDQELSKKVDSVQGKGLSSNDFTNDAKSKVDAIPADAKYTDTVYDDTEIKKEISTVKQDLLSKYEKPSTGIAENDLSAEVKAKLNSNNGVTWRVENGILYADYEEGE